MRKSDIFILFLTASSLLVLVTVVDAILQQEASTELLQNRSKLVEELDLTDLALFTEARYTRHITQADLHSAFQDHPMGLEHFPSGSIQPPPLFLQEKFKP